MRVAGAAAGLVVVVTAAAALAQPTSRATTPGWRAVASAALAFGHAEGKLAALRRFAITSAPQTKQAADAALDELDRHAQAAREAFGFVARYGSPFWAAAAEIRIGDTFMCQAEKIAAIPIPPSLASAAQRLPPKVLAQYLEVLHGLVKPLEDQAARVWEHVAANSDASAFWSRAAHDRLAGTSSPDCW